MANKLLESYKNRIALTNQCRNEVICYEVIIKERD